MAAQIGKIYIWDALPLNGELPNRTLLSPIGSVLFNQPRGVQSRPVLLNAGRSPRGREFAAKNCDIAFLSAIDEGQFVIAQAPVAQGRHRAHDHAPRRRAEGEAEQRPFEQGRPAPAVRIEHDQERVAPGPGIVQRPRSIHRQVPGGEAVGQALDVGAARLEDLQVRRVVHVAEQVAVAEAHGETMGESPA